MRTDFFFNSLTRKKIFRFLYDFLLSGRQSIAWRLHRQAALFLAATFYLQSDDVHCKNVVDVGEFFIVAKTIKQLIILSNTSIDAWYTHTFLPIIRYESDNE
jgi:hypothetical protein